VNKSEDEALTQKEFAKRVGWRPAYISQLKKRGRLVMTEDGRKVLYHASLERIRATRDPSTVTPHKPSGEPAPEAAEILSRPVSPEEIEPAAAGTTIDYQSARAKREHYNAELARMEYERAAGRLVEIDLVREVILNATTTLRTHLEQMAERLAPRVLDAENEEQVRSVVLEEVELAMGDLQATFRKHALRQPESATETKNRKTAIGGMD